MTAQRDFKFWAPYGSPLWEAVAELRAGTNNAEPAVVVWNAVLLAVAVQRGIHLGNFDSLMLIDSDSGDKRLIGSVTACGSEPELHAADVIVDRRRRSDASDLPR